MNNKTNTPQISRLEAFLDSGEMVKNPIEVFEKYRKKLGPTFTFYFGGTKRTIVTTDPDIIKHVLKDNHSNYQKSDIQVKRMAEFQGKGLLNSHGDYWLKQRRLLSMGFSRSRLSNLMPLQLIVLKDFMNRFEIEINKGSVDIHHEMIQFTLRSVGKSLFGNTMNDSEMDKLGETISEIQAFMVKQIVQPYKIPWFRISGQTGHFQKMRREADNLVKEYVNQRRKGEAKEWDMLQLMFETPYKDTGEFMSDEQVMIEILQLLVAGNETSSNALSWTFYMLAQHPEYITKIRDEITLILGDAEITYEGLHKLTFTMNVLDESMRLFPPFWMIDRVAMEDDSVSGIKIPAGTTIVPYIYGLHHNSTIWEDPDKFDPARFSLENNYKKHSFAHIPFGGGPRVCIGQNMAMMQILLVLASIIKKYDFKLTDGALVKIHPMMILRPDGPIKMDFFPVKSNG